MRLELSSPVRRRAFFAGCALLIISAWALCCQSVVAHWLAAAGTPEGLRRAARMQPLNADYEQTLGTLYMDPGFANFDLARVHFERAAAINRHASSIWLGLAGAYEVAGDTKHRGEAIRNAVVSEPKDTQVQWQAANFFLDSDPDRTLHLLRGVVENDPNYTLPAFALALHATNNDTDRAIQAVPATTSVRLELMRWLLGRNDTAAADKVWPTLLSASGSLRVNDTFVYLDSLIARHRVPQAQAAWSAMVNRDPLLRRAIQPGNLVFNGDFEENLLNGGFAWRYVPTSGVTASLDTSTIHSGTRSMALQIDANDLLDSGLSQLVVVEPNTRYTASAWLHAEELEAAHGIRVAVADAYTGAELMATEEMLGSFPWREVNGDFETKPDTQLVKFEIVRSPSNGRIRGRVWIDEIKMEKR